MQHFRSLLTCIRKAIQFYEEKIATWRRLSCRFAFGSVVGLSSHSCFSHALLKFCVMRHGKSSDAHDATAIFHLCTILDVAQKPISPLACCQFLIYIHYLFRWLMYTCGLYHTSVCLFSVFAYGRKSLSTAPIEGKRGMEHRIRRRTRKVVLTLTATVDPLCWTANRHLCYCLKLTLSGNQRLVYYLYPSYYLPIASIRQGCSRSQ